MENCLNSVVFGKQKQEEECDVKVSSVLTPDRKYQNPVFQRYIKATVCAIVFAYLYHPASFQPVFSDCNLDQNTT